jgi:type II secretory pathway pseudopilin PulG
MEALLVLAILGLAASVCLPLIGGWLEEAKLDAAAQDAVDALRFAQTNSVKTQTVHGVVFDPTLNLRRVFYLDALAAPTTAVNPCDKRSYLLRYAEDSQLAGVSVDSAEFEYEDGEVANFVEFDAQGSPRRSATLEMLESGEVVLALGERTRTVEVRPNGTVAAR